MRRALPLLVTFAALALPALTAGCGAGGHVVHDLPRTGADITSWAANLESRLSTEEPGTELLGQLALARMHQGRIAEAERLASRANSRSACDPVALAISARIAFARGVHEVSVRRYDDASRCAMGRLGERAQEGRVASHIELAKARLAGGQVAASVRLLVRALGWARSGPQEQLQALGLIADAAAQDAIRQSALALAIEALGIALESLEDEPMAGRLRGQLGVLKGELTRGNADLARWAESSVERWTEVARFHASLGDGERELEAWRRATADEAATLSTWTERADAALARSHIDEAVTAYERAAGLAPTDRVRAEHLVECAGRLGYDHVEASERLVTAAVQAAPDHWPSVRALVTVLVRGDRDADVPTVVAAYVARAEAPLQALEQSAGLLDTLGRRLDAVRLLESAVAAPDPPPRAELTLVRLLHKRRSDWGRRNEVLEAYEIRVVDDLETSIAVGKLWIQFRHPNRARVIAERLRASQPKRFEGGLLLADALRAVGRRNSEKAMISETVAAAAEPGRAALAVGLRYLEWREHARAATWLQTALAGVRRSGSARNPGGALSGRDALERDAHRGLVDALMGQHPPARRAAARHMRRWLALTPEAERVTAIEHLLKRVAGIADMSGLRIDLLQALAARRPGDSEVLGALGHALLEGERWEMAGAIFTDAIEHAESPREVTLRAGRALVTAGRVRQALGFFERVRLRPTELDVQTWRLLGEHLCAAGQTDRADAYFAKLLERTASGGHLSELSIFARAALRLGAWERAVQAAHQLIARRADHRDAMLVMGEALVRLERHEEAEAWFRRFIQAAPSTQRAKGQLAVGERLVALGRLRNAAEHFEAALREHGSHRSAALFERLVALRRRMGDKEGLERAASLYVAHAESSRGASRAALSAARALEQAGMHEHAWQVLGTAMEGARGDRTLLEAAATNALVRGDVRAATGLYGRLVRQRGTSGRIWQEISQKLVDAGQAEVALTLLSTAAERPGAPAMLHVVLGRRLLEVGRMDEADTGFQRAVSQAGSLSEVAKAVEEAYRSVGQLRRLEAFYVGLVAMAPTRTEPPLTLGTIRLELGDPVGAEQAFARYLAANPRGHLAVAEAHGRHGEVALALTHYRRAWEQPAPGGSALPLEKLARWLSACGHANSLGWFVNLHVRRAQEPGPAAREASAAYESIGDLAGALRWLGEADKLAPDAKHELARGSLLLASGDVAGARDAWGQYIERRHVRGGMTRSGRAKSTRTMAEAAVEVAELWTQARRFEDAMRTVREAAAKYGDTPLLAVTEAHYLVRMGQVEAALARARATVGPAVAPTLKQAPIGAIQAFVGALRDRERDSELAELLQEIDVSSWSHDLGLVQLAVLGDLERWDEAARLAGVLTRSGKPALDLSVGLQAFHAGLYDLSAHHLRRALRKGVDEPLSATRALDAIKALRPGSPLDSGSVDHSNASFTAVPQGDRLGALVLSAQQLADKHDIHGAFTAALEALRLAPDDVQIFGIALSLAVLAGDGPRLDSLLSTLRSRQHPRLVILKVAVKRLAHGLRPELARRLQSELIAAQPGVSEHHIVAVGLALQAGDDVAARWHTDALLAVAGAEPQVLLQLAERWQRWMRPDAAEALLARLDGAGGVVAVEREMVRLRGALLAGDTDRVDRAVAAVLLAGKDDPRLRLRAASLALALGALPQRARRWMAPALELRPITDRTLALGARAAWRTGATDRARVHLKSLLSLHRVDVSLWGGVVGAAIGVGDVEALELLMEHLPTRAAWKEPAIAVVGMAASSLEYEAPRMTPEAKVAVADAVDRMIERAAGVARTASPALAAAAAITAEVRGDEAGALAAYEVPLIAASRSPVHANNLAYVLSRFGRDLDRALALVTIAQVRAGEPVTSYTDTEAWIRYRMGDFHTARQLMALTVHGAHEREARSPAGQVEMLYHYAATLEATGEEGRAWSVWRDCARRDPLSPYGRLCDERFQALRGRQRGALR